MANDTVDTAPGKDAPIMPAGSGSADLNIAREQDALASDTTDPEAAMPIDDDDGEFSNEDTLGPNVGGEDAEVSEAQPS